MEHESREFGALARWLLLSKGDPIIAHKMADDEYASANIVKVLKSAVSSGNLSNPSWAAELAPLRSIVDTFVGTLRPQSVFARILTDNGFVRLPLNQKLALVGTAGTASVVGQQGGAIPLTKLALSNQSLPPLTAAAILVFTEELLRQSAASSVPFIEGELGKAISAAIDGEFLRRVSVGAITVGSTGAMASDALADLRALLDVVNTTGASGGLYWILPPTLANSLTVTADTAGATVFPAMGPRGGTLLNVPALVSDRLASDEMLLIDAGGICADFGTIAFDMSRQGAVEMSDAPTADSRTGVGSTAVSLWQTNSVGMRAIGLFGAERFRSTAVARLVDADWGPAAST